MMKQIRAFIAIDPGQEVRKRIAVVQESLRSGTQGVRWVKPQNMHLTLKFLGNIAADNAEKLSGELKETLRGFSPFELRFEGAGVFPNAKRPRVLWIGARSEGNHLQELEQKISRLVSAFGIPADDRPFRAHLTLGRIKGKPPGIDLLNRLEKTDTRFGSVAIDRVFMMQSRLTPEGPIYTVLFEIHL